MRPRVFKATHPAGSTALSPLPGERHQMTYAGADGTDGSGLVADTGHRRLIEPGARTPIGRKLI